MSGRRRQWTPFHEDAEPQPTPPGLQTRQNSNRDGKYPMVTSTKECASFSCEKRPLLSLWEIMQKFYLDTFCQLFSVMSQRVQVASTQSASSPRSEISRAWIEKTKLEVLMPATVACAQLGLEESVAFAGRLAVEWDTPVRCEEFQWGLHHLSELMQSEMKKLIYVSIPENLATHYKDKAPFGDDVYNAFPSARFDISEAGTSLACGCNSAAAFHLMRAAEIGLWELGRDRQIPLASAGKIEFTEWGKIIGKLETAVQAIQKWPNTPAKEDAHRFYNSALVEIRAFNDGWRRHIAHVRTNQQELQDDETLALWGHVSRFLSQLAGKISEGKYTFLIWP
jgi:hypothetical protein